MRVSIAARDTDALQRGHQLPEVIRQLGESGATAGSQSLLILKRGAQQHTDRKVVELRAGGLRWPLPIDEASDHVLQTVVENTALELQFLGEVSFGGRLFGRAALAGNRIDGSVVVVAIRREVARIADDVLDQQRGCDRIARVVNELLIAGTGILVDVVGHVAWSARLLLAEIGQSIGKERAE